MAKVDKSQRATGSGLLRRAYPAQFEVRGKSGATVEIRGYATVYDAPYEMYDMFGSYTEVVRQGAGKKTLSESPQVQWLLNHEGLSMAYTKAGTLQLGEDSTGLEAVAQVNSARGDVRDMLLAIEDRNVDEMSFAFRVPSGKSVWSPDYDQRDITEYNLHRGDVSTVNFGANPATEVGLRAQDIEHMSERGARALYERLQHRLQVVVVDTGDGDEEGDDDTQLCPSCGAGNEEDALYCDQCGAALPEPTTSALSQPRSQTRRHDLSLYEAELVLLG
jgi:HK97 family phage prohead protease